jgi:polyhydroxyalkanoate synthesis regulator phasin
VAAGGGAVAMASTDHAKPTTKSGASASKTHDHFGAADAGTRSVVEAIEKAARDGAAAIVDPIIDQAVTDGKLTAAQAATAKQAVTDLQAGKRPSADALALLRDADARAVAQSAATAVAQKVPALAAPIISAAVTAGTITQAQADQLTARIAAMASGTGRGGLGIFGGPGGGPGFGPGGHDQGGARGPGKAGAVSDATRAVLQDVATAVLKQAPSVAGPIIDGAVSAGTITSAQGDALKAAASDVATKGPQALADHRDLLSSDGVRTVVASIAKALSAQAPTVGNPIVDQAVTAGKITKAQGDAIEARLAKGFAGGPFGGPGGPGRGAHPGGGGGGRRHG